MEKSKRAKRIAAQIIFVIVCAVLWQWYANKRGLMGFPPLDVIFAKLIDSFSNPKRPILVYMGHSLFAIVKGREMRALRARLLSSLAVLNETIGAIYNLVVSVFDLLPGVALLPILMITIGANDTSILILVIHSVIWPMSRSIMDGFRRIPKIYIESGKNFGLHTFGLIIDVFVPAALANVLSGLKVGWARAWRGLIRAEMIFGAAQSAGIGVFINNARTVWIDYASVYAALFLIILVGVIVEYGVFQVLEKSTVRKWGMVR